eukprot:jgi/Tetstr1/428426/TSEL_018440.t1
MALFSRRIGSALTLGALGLAVLAMFAPLPEPSHSGGGKGSGGTASCPLGYTETDGVPLPEDHPPVAQHLQPVDRDGDGSTLYTNALVWTGDPQAPWADSFSVAGDGAILAVGRGAELARRGRHSAVTDLQGNFVAPGFVDAHVHLMRGGLSLRELDLSSVSSVQELVAAVAGAAAEGDGWLLGRGWNNDRWGGEMPRASWIDQATGGRPALLQRWDMHCAVANSAALAAAGLTPDTPDPPGGVIERGEDGALTGLLKDAAIALMNAVIPPPTAEENRDALERAMDYFAAQGVTAVHDMGRADFLEGPGAAWRDFEEVLLPAANDDRLKLRVHAALPLASRAQVKAMVDSLGWAHPGGFLTWGTLKAFADGSLGSRTAKMHEPYDDTPSTGIWVTNMTQLRDDIIAADAQGFQVAVHAIGDQAVDELLACYAAARAANGPRDATLPRHRIEHAQHIAGPETVSQMLAADVQVVTNPLHLLDDMRIIPHSLGEARGAPSRAFAQETFLKAGVPVSCGSDWPVVHANALSSLYSAVYRRSALGAGSHDVPSGGMQPAEALAAHTSHAESTWFAAASGRQTGRLVPVPSQRRVAGGAADSSGMRRNDAKQDKPSQTFPSYRVCSDQDKQGKRTKSRNNTKILRYRESRTGAVEALVTSGCLTWTHTPQSLIVATIEMTVCGGCTPKSLWASYRSALAKHPVKTQALTTALLWSIGDIFSQFIEDNEGGVVDISRTLYTAIFAACFIGPVGHFWYIFLEHAACQVFAQGTTAYVALKWFNFSMVPVEHQLLVVNFGCILDCTFLCWANSQEGWADRLLLSMRGSVQSF